MTPSRYIRSLVVPPTSLVIGGKIQFGCFNNPIKAVNLKEASRPYGIPLPSFLQQLQLREWQAVQAFNGRYFLMSAIYQARKMALVQFILYDTKTGRKWRYEKKVAPWKMSIAQGLFSSQSLYADKTFRIRVSNELDTAEPRVALAATIAANGELPQLNCTVAGDHSAEKVAPTVVSLPFGDTDSNRGMYSHKVMMQSKGSVWLGEEEISFDHGTMILDDHKGYYPWPTKYDWATAMGVVSQEGTRLAFNLTNNQVKDQERFNENVLWVDNKVYTLPPIEFERPRGYEGKWLIRDHFGMVDLVFEPITHNNVNVDLVIFESRYRGPYGLFNGTIHSSEGKKFEIKDLFGMGEDFYLRI